MWMPPETTRPRRSSAGAGPGASSRTAITWARVRRAPRAPAARASSAGLRWPAPRAIPARTRASRSAQRPARSRSRSMISPMTDASTAAAPRIRMSRFVNCSASTRSGPTLAAPANLVPSMLRPPSGDFRSAPPVAQDALTWRIGDSPLRAPGARETISRHPSVCLPAAMPLARRRKPPRARSRSLSVVRPPDPTISISSAASPCAP